MHIHLKVIGTHPFLGNIGHLNPKTNLGNKVGKKLMGAIHHILGIFLNILCTQLHVILTIHLHQPQPQPQSSQIYTPIQLPVPPFPNPHIEVAHPTYNAEVQHFQTSSLEFNGIHLNSGRVLQKRYYLDVIEGPHREEEHTNEKIKEPWAALDEEQTLKSEIEKASSWLPSNPPCIQENN